MLRALKWAFDLGVRHERIRISAHLQSLSRQMSYDQEDMMMLLDNSKVSKSRKERLQFDMAVDKKVKEAIESIMRARPLDLGFSIMFPDDKHHGEIK